MGASINGGRLPISSENTVCVDKQLRPEKTMGKSMVACMTVYFDAQARMKIHRMGYEEADGKRRPHMLILNGMLLRVAVNMVEPGPKPKPRSRNRPPKKRKGGYSPEAFPDLGAMLCVVEFEPYFDQTRLSDYIHRFAETVIPLLNLEPESVKYIRDNLGRVVDFLVEKLNNGHLRFYKLLYSEIEPEDGGAIAFLDVSNPAQVEFIYPVFGLIKTTASIGRIPWRPLENESQEPEPTLYVECDN